MGAAQVEQVSLLQVFLKLVGVWINKTVHLWEP